MIMWGESGKHLTTKEKKMMHPSKIFIQCHHFCAKASVVGKGPHGRFFSMPSFHKSPFTFSPPQRRVGIYNSLLRRIHQGVWQYLLQVPNRITYWTWMMLRNINFFLWMLLVCNKHLKNAMKLSCCQREGKLWKDWARFMTLRHLCAQN